MNEQIQIEERHQSGYWFMYKSGNVFVGLFVLIAIYNGHDVFGLFAIAAILAFNAWRVSVTIAEFEERMKHVVFLTQIENLYVTSEYADQPDTTVVATFKATVEYLKQVGNTHEVRVHLLIFRDVSRFTWWYDAAGKLQKEKQDRELLSSAETWEQYLEAVERFKIEDRDKRLRQIRKDNAGFDWTNENVFGQWQSGK